MPTYEYRCEQCGHAFEKFHSMTASPIKTCPQCGKRSVKRLISGGGGILFKGSGFYETDYRSKSYQEAAKKDKPPEKETPKKRSKEGSPSKKPSSEKGSDTKKRS